MTLHYEIKNPEIIAFIKAQAKQTKKSPKEVVEFILETLVMAVTDSQNKEELASSQFEKIRKSLLVKRKGKPFSDSTDIIRASRQHDH